MMHEIEHLAEKPEGLLELVAQAVAQPGQVTADALWDCVERFREWGIAGDATIAHFTLDISLRWR